MIVSLIAGNSGSVLCLAVFSYNFILALVALASLIAGLYDPDFVLRPYQIELSRWQILLVFIPALALAIGLVSYTNSW